MAFEKISHDGGWVNRPAQIQEVRPRDDPASTLPSWCVAHGTAGMLPSSQVSAEQPRLPSLVLRIVPSRPQLYDHLGYACVQYNGGAGINRKVQPLAYGGVKPLDSQADQVNDFIGRIPGRMLR